MNENKRHRNYCFTSFSEDEPTYSAGQTYLIYQKEKCPGTGKNHWQGYVEFNEGKTLSAAKKSLGCDSIHLEVRRGTQEQAIQYCKKEESYDGVRREYGIPAKPGKRTDLDGMVDMVFSGNTCFEILQEYRGNALRHINMINKALETAHGFNQMDQWILRRRREDGSTEVGGNTVRPHDEYLSMRAGCTPSFLNFVEDSQLNSPK